MSTNRTYTEVKNAINANIPVYSVASFTNPDKKELRPVVGYEDADGNNPDTIFFIKFDIAERSTLYNWMSPNESTGYLEYY